MRAKPPNGDTKGDVLLGPNTTRRGRPRDPTKGTRLAHWKRVLKRIRHIWRSLHLPRRRREVATLIQHGVAVSTFLEYWRGRRCPPRADALMKAFSDRFAVEDPRLSAFDYYCLIQSADPLDTFLPPITSVSAVTRGGPPDSLFDPLAWSRTEADITEAIRLWDYPAADSIAERIRDPIHRLILRAHVLGMRGETERALAIYGEIEDTAYPSIFQQLPRAAQRCFLRSASRVNGFVNIPKALSYSERVSKLGLLRDLTPIQRVGYLREHMNLLLKTASSPEAYSDANGTVVARAKSVLGECLYHTGLNLDSALRFDEVVGPLVLCMKGTVDVMTTLRRDLTHARAAVQRQLSLLRSVVKRDKSVGIVRFTPLANQAMRCGDVTLAHEIMDEQREIWRAADPDPARSNSFEYAASLIQTAVIEGTRGRDAGTSNQLLDSAGAVLSKGRQHVFDEFIAKARDHVARLANGDAGSGRDEVPDSHGSGDLGGAYYTFGW